MIVPEGFLQVMTLQMVLKCRPIGFTMGNSCSRNSETGERVGSREHKKSWGVWALGYVARNCHHSLWLGEVGGG